MPLDQNDQFQDRLQSFLGSISDIGPQFSSLKVGNREIDLGIRELVAGIKRRDITTLSEVDFHVSKNAHTSVVHLLPQFSDLAIYVKRSHGIVIVGGGRFTPMAIVSILMLRRTKSKLPVEVFLPNENDYDHYICEILFKELNTRCITLSRVIKGHQSITRYQYKVFAIILSSFEDVIFLDADSIPIMDPSKLFHQEPYTLTGLVTWPDFWISSASHLFYEITDQPTPSLLKHASSESGQIMISKRQHNQSLLLALYYNFYGPAFYYKLLSQKAAGEGDKETWVAAATALNKTYYQVREGAQPVGRHINGTYKYGGMLQYHPSNDYKLQIKTKATFRESSNPVPIFFHLNGVKPNSAEWLNGQYGKRLWGPLNETMRRFGRDLERDIWDEVKLVACELGPSMMCFKDSAALCEGLKMSWEHILMEE
jgi:alpha 1,2-mannosyltransferase